MEALELRKLIEALCSEDIKAYFDPPTTTPTTMGSVTWVHFGVSVKLTYPLARFREVESRVQPKMKKNILKDLQEMEELMI